MLYRLGSIPFPSLALDLQYLLDLPIPRGRSGGIRPRRGRETWEEFVRSVVSALRKGRAVPGSEWPDLLEALPAESPDRAWVERTAEALEARHRRSPRLALLRCEWERDGGGFVAISACDGGVADAVRTGDSVSAGFVAIRDGGGLRVLPRIYRKVCANGAVVFQGEQGDALAGAGDVAEAVEACFRKPALEGTVGRLRRAARTPVPSPAALLVRARAASEVAEVLAAFEAAGDRTAWGLINAATAAARGESDFRRRVERERDAERILRALGPKSEEGGGELDGAGRERNAGRAALSTALP
ncbi:MAG: hypothetical protein L0323_22160 [Planctomycetes bacterium]|nr:hypothetical protein [Planctomycetota bacterium]